MNAAQQRAVRRRLLQERAARERHQVAQLGAEIWLLTAPWDRAADAVARARRWLGLATALGALLIVRRPRRSARLARRAGLVFTVARMLWRRGPLLRQLATVRRGPAPARSVARSTESAAYL